MIAASKLMRLSRAAALSGLLVASPGAAQTANPEADALSREAATLYSAPTRFRDAAELHAQAAALRSVDDPRLISDLVSAGRLFVYAGDAIEGRRYLEKAARTALVNGDLAGAGHTYIDAAFVAAQAADNDTAKEMLRAALWIATAPMLEPADERRLRRRMTAEDSN